MATKLTKDNFDASIAEGVTLVDFFADWCGPCKMLGPVIDELASKFEGQHKIYKVDVDTEEELAVRYGVMTIPTVILFKDGEELDKRIGVHPIEEFEGMLTKA
ncbi:MAG: thioredoxin [Oscillospiraceae bacterium]|nr:thioredoxin [Oscillospiraceae bacterium]